MQKKISIIFGGTRGIGKVVSKTLAKRDDLVITAYRKNLK